MKPAASKPAWQSHHADADDAKHGAEDLAERGDGYDVAVAHRGHGDDRPPDGAGNAAEGLGLGALFGEKGEAGGDDAQQQKQEKRDADASRFLLQHLREQ